MNINQRSTIILTIINNKKDKERNRNILGWGTHSAIFREKMSLLHRAKQIHTHMCFKSYAFLSQIQQPVISIECSEGSPNLMNTIVLKII